MMLVESVFRGIYSEYLCWEQLKTLCSVTLGLVGGGLAGRGGGGLWISMEVARLSLLPFAAGEGFFSPFPLLGISWRCCFRLVVCRLSHAWWLLKINREMEVGMLFVCPASEVPACEFEVFFGPAFLFRAVFHARLLPEFLSFWLNRFLEGHVPSLSSSSMAK